MSNNNGFIRITCFFEYADVKDPNSDSTYRRNVICDLDFIGPSYVPKRDVVLIKRFDKFSKMVDYDAFNEFDNVNDNHTNISIAERYQRVLYVLTNLSNESMKNICTCDALDRFNMHLDVNLSNQSDDAFDEGIWKCKCAPNHLFPAYIIAVKNTTGIEFGGRGIPKVVEYIVHPDERENMARFIAGTDNSMHDLVHELRFNPHIALEPELRKAQQDFDQRKRQKT